MKTIHTEKFANGKYVEIVKYRRNEYLRIRADDGFGNLVVVFTSVPGEN